MNSSNEGTAPLSKSRVLELLRSERRRAVLRCLDEGEGVRTLNELAASIRSDEGASDAPPGRRPRIAVEFDRNHLPKLADADVIEYDRTRETIRSRGDHRLLFEVLYLLEE